MAAYLFGDDATPEKYRTREEIEKARTGDKHVRAVIEAAVADAASVITAMEMDESPETVDLLVNNLYNGLRAELVDGVEDDGSPHYGHEDRLRAIVLLLQPHAEHLARHAMRNDLPDDPDAWR